MKKIMFNDRFGLTDAVLEGKKTVTRRVVKIDSGFEVSKNYGSHLIEKNSSTLVKGKILPPYKAGEVVAVAQSYYSVMMSRVKVPYKFDINITSHKGWDNKMFVRADLMPRQVHILSVTAERLQDITDEECINEWIRVEYAPDGRAGYFIFDNKRMREKWFDSPRDAYATLIDKISGKGTWKSDPWVWRIEFELIK